jgi:hypothetical protein
MQHRERSTEPPTENLAGRVYSTEEIEAGRLYTVLWQDLDKAARMLPELAQPALDLIETGLGYLPHPCVTLPEEPSIRLALHKHRRGDWDETICHQRLLSSLKRIRNRDMRHNAEPVYHPEIYQTYAATYYPYGYAVRQRLVHLLGYEPALACSLMAELWVRKAVAGEPGLLLMEETALDRRAITLIRYREVVLARGKKEADGSILPCAA